MRWLLGLLLSLCFVTGFSSSSTVLNFKHWQTKNGMRVYFTPAPSLSMLSMNLVFNAGSSRDGTVFGLANFVSSLIGEGAQGMSANEIADDFSAVGAQFGTSSSRDTSTLSLTTLTQKKYFTKAMSTFIHVVSKPNFNSNAMSLIKNQIKTSLQLQAQSPTATAQKALFKTLYATTPYAHSVLGTRLTVSAFTQAQALGFYHKYYVAKNAVLVMVGNLTLKQAHALSSKVSQSFSEGLSAAPISGAPVVKKSKTIHISFPAKQTTVLIASPGIAYHDPSFFPLFVGNYVLGGSSLSSILNDQMREKRGLVYGVNSVFRRMSLAGPFYIWFQTKSDQTKEAVTLATDTLKKFMSTTMTPSKLMIAKKSIDGSFPLAFASNQGILGVLTNIAFYKLPDNYLDNFKRKINEVTSKKINAAFNKTISVNKLITIEVGPNGAS
jgi:zinc protease